MITFIFSGDVGEQERLNIVGWMMTGERWTLYISVSFQERLDAISTWVMAMAAHNNLHKWDCFCHRSSLSP